MEFYQFLDDVTLENSWVTIGTFDGVHRGHQALIQKMLAGAHAESSPAVVVTFHPHPREIVSGKTGAFYLTLPTERVRLLTMLGIDAVVVLPFTKNLAAMSALDFTQELVDRLGMAQLCVGHGFALGKAREGDVPRLRQLGQLMGFRVQEVAPERLDGEIISSSLIRSLISEGKVDQAGKLLGRQYQIAGKIVPGDQRGRRVGIPTANIEPSASKLIPATGVYACCSEVRGEKYAAAVNIGIRPTFSGQSGDIFIEAHLLDFSDDLYGETLTLHFQQRLRDERRFESVDALVEQVKADIQQAREIFQT